MLINAGQANAATVCQSSIIFYYFCSLYLDALWLSKSVAHLNILNFLVPFKHGKRISLLLFSYCLSISDMPDWIKFYMADWPSNDVQGDAGYQDVIECANALATVYNF